ncbi:hypothetical protein KO505_16515 [Psychrosphaera sp. F3M07]|uniref:hypothetical protein n=1 Tax=Psychrosphaera sp. F3M07 TaxID=2841560 RepID=UPI001C09D8AB|nr:hypothetical protein [Psychrosphaera sp. F3M07]MBU2919551.1 hypothetical protein [Psychrosphaera sp. F3M07]
MAYDFGAQSLGIKNPFKAEGKIKTIAGLIITIIGVYILLQVPENLKVDKVLGWVYAGLGFILIISGLKRCSAGLYQLFKYFVGRSVPISLSYNFSKTESDNAKAEKDAVLYNHQELNSMLLGRKNSTFIEPTGWLSRFIHTILPKLTFLPYPLRNTAEELASVVINTITAIAAYAIASFVVLSGLAGEKAQIFMLPIFSALLLVYLITTWKSSAHSLESANNYKLNQIAGKSVIGLIALSFVIPMLAGFYLDELIPVSMEVLAELKLEQYMFSAWGNLGIFFVSLFVLLGLIVPLLLSRMNDANPQTSVSEYRDNLQENVHPKEIFINVENIILANRRVKEVPNRIYKEFNPELVPESDKKGTFNGELLIETQPELTSTEVKNKTNKILLTLFSQVGLVATVVLLCAFIFQAIELYIYLQPVILANKTASNQLMNSVFLIPIVGFVSKLLFIYFAWRGTKAISRILESCSHTFWGEIHFSSLLMNLKVEGTYTESKMATGMGINDSTRSENFVVRSSITPWLITSRIDSCVFATSGSNNLETPRYIMSMNKNDLEMEQIVEEMKTFLVSREVIAALRNTQDLDNTMQILEVNNKSREFLSKNQESLTEQAGYLRNEDNTDNEENVTDNTSKQV